MPNKLIRIHFEDQGQDFLSWDVRPIGAQPAGKCVLGKIVASNPCQGSTWCGMFVLDTRLRRGATCYVSQSPLHTVRTVNYKIIKVEEIEVVESEPEKEGTAK